MLDGPQVATVASLVTVWTLATTALASRLAARRVTQTPLWLDDFICLAAYVFGTTYNVWVLVWIRDGYGLRRDEITWLSRADALDRARRDVYFCEAFSSLSIGTSKLAILALYWRLFSRTRIRYATLYLGFLSFCWLVARTTVGVIRCVPAVAFWDTSVQGDCFVDERKFILGGSISHLLLDSLILALPYLELRKRRLNFWPKLGVTATYICGTLTGVCGVGVLVSVLVTPREAEDAILFMIVEVNLLIVTSCLPLLLPIVEVVRNHVKPSNWSCSSCTHAGASPPPAPTFNLNTAQEQRPRRPRHYHFPMSLPTTNGMWSRLSSSATSKVNAGARERARTESNRTVMTVSHDEVTRGVHVHLRREFRFVSPSEPEPIRMRPRRAGSSKEPPSTARGGLTEGEALTLDEGDVIDRMEKGEGKAVEEVSNVTRPSVAGVDIPSGSSTGLMDGTKATEECNKAGPPDNEGAMSDETQTTPESKDDPEGAGETRSVENMERVPEEIENDNQKAEMARLDAS